MKTVMAIDTIPLLPPALFPLLFITGGVAGLIDTIAGGGGLITLPVLLALGVPPQHALGTNKLQSSFGSGSACAHFLRAGAVRLGEARWGMACTALGAALGAIAVQMIDPSFLKRLIPFLLLGILLYTVFSPRLGAGELRPRLPRALFFPLFGFLLGFYDGFLGPGTGSFWVIALVTGLGFDLRKGTAYTKLFNFVSNAVSLAFFLAGGHVLFAAGVVMGAGQAAGARVGAHLVLRKGAEFVRPVFICSVFILTVKLFFDSYR